MRRRARVDANQSAIVAALRQLGWGVEVTSHVGRGLPDLIAMRGGHVYFLEVKDGEKPPSARALTGEEAALHARWARYGVRVVVVESVDGVRRLGDT